MTTIKQLAAELNLSTATVSMALRGSRLISEATTQRVLTLARERHYVPNNFGRGLQSNRSHLIGAMITSVTASFWNDLIERAGYTAAAHNYGFLTGWAGAEAAGFEAQLRLLLEKNVDGFFFAVPFEVVQPHLKWLEVARKPFVFCSNPCPAQYNCVINDDFSGGFQAVRHLADNGHSAIALSNCVPERYRGFLAGAAVPGVVTHTFARSGELPELLRIHPEITAIAAYSDHEAITIRHTLGALGLRVPEDISLVGYDDFWFAGLPEFDFTTIAQQKAIMGELAVERLLELIGGATDTVLRRLEPELVVRGSVRPQK